MLVKYPQKYFSVFVKFTRGGHSNIKIFCIRTFFLDLDFGLFSVALKSLYLRILKILHHVYNCLHLCLSGVLQARRSSWENLSQYLRFFTTPTLDIHRERNRTGYHSLIMGRNDVCYHCYHHYMNNLGVSVFYKADLNPWTAKLFKAVKAQENNTIVDIIALSVKSLTCLICSLSFTDPYPPVYFLLQGEASADTLFRMDRWPLLPGNEGRGQPAVITAHHLHTLLPAVKLITLVRNPVDR